MSQEVETKLRGPEGFSLARRAVEQMERHGIWPTAVNFELWVNYLADPDGALGQEINRLLEIGDAFTDSVSEGLAALYLPKAKLNDQIRDTGDQLSRELASVSAAINSAKQSSEAYGLTLATASQSLTAEKGMASLEATVKTLAGATQRVQAENKSLERRLSESSSEVARLREHLEQVRRDATTDGLTNLANRKAFDEELERACQEADATGRSLTLALIDIDHFKGFNDTWGHQTGDQVIRYVASVIGRLGATPRLAARYGGEEFAIIFPSEDHHAAFTTLEEIRQEIASRVLKRRSTNEDLGKITVSAGFAERHPGESGHNVMERADSALYASKHGGRNLVSMADPIPTAA
ncbi:diguanylate cyclase [Phenylobacterium sp.]|uniref:diguanylate cyclase n=1 Tax=Phenylobacterium sp. TaxID=1871053 RepID=UPI00272F11AB|nr:diguanylate cyclase [Phenylobacterium sp.]MDP1619168.1 diguanylate cyclase [Phenylobacterium sp.]MDP1987540.1 diguanylate cyclase [Phenylobacterium sp.]